MSSSIMDRWNAAWDNFTITIKLNPETQRYVALGLLSTDLLLRLTGDVAFDASRYMEVLGIVSDKGYCFEDHTEDEEG
jgi:hypothetical protein